LDCPNGYEPIVFHDIGAFLIVYSVFLSFSDGLPVMMDGSYISVVLLVMAIRKMCVASNVGWLFVSSVAVTGSVIHGSKDYLFLIRYLAAFISSLMSLTAIKVYPKRIVGRLSILLFAPFIILECMEICIVHKCGGGIDSYWGIECASLVMYRDDARLIEVITDQLAVLLLSVTNIWILWRCHMTQGHLIYDMKKLRKAISPEPFLSAISSVDGAISDFISADEGGETMQSPKKVLFLSFVFISFVEFGFYSGSQYGSTVHCKVIERASVRRGESDYRAPTVSMRGPYDEEILCPRLAPSSME
jgi:hypothetical protein